MINKIIPILVAVLSLAVLATCNAITEGPTQIIKDNPIVINTVAKHYQNPTIDEYELCTKTRESCLDKCSFRDDNCKEKCPICPILVNTDALVQGINDTLYRLPMSSGPVNQTTIVRLTNEIRNIIKTNLGNITANLENNINVYQNRTSRIGGRFGLGYNENGSCCHLIEPRRCRRAASGIRCLPRRLRTCGSHCLSRVMQARRIVTCNEQNPTDCSSQMEYVPQPRRPGCRYISKYPFMKCSTHATLPRRTSCRRCFQIPYMNVMRGQLPRDCRPCFSRRHAATTHYRRLPFYAPRPVYPYSMYPPYGYYDMPVADYGLYDDEMPHAPIEREVVSGEIEERKCVNENGTIQENCQGNGETEENNGEVDDTEPNEDYDNEEGDAYEDEGDDYYE